MANRLILCFGALLFFNSCQKSPPKINLPNIIWLVAEDQSPEFFPMYGNSTVSLPYLSDLAKEGVVFENAYSPVPVCAPARSALISGLYPSSLGTHNMRTYNAYNPENQPSIGIPSYSPPVPKGVKMFTYYLRSMGYYTTNNAKEDYNFKKTAGAWDESSQNAHWKNRAPNQPFFSVFNFGITHESQIWKQQNEPLLIAPESVPIPPIFPETETVRKDLAVNYSNLIRLDRKIGKVIEQLKAEGLYEKSIIFFYADHGGPFPRYKRALYETGIKVPLIVKFPNGEMAGSRDMSFISFIDFAPTVLSLAGIKPPEIMQGKAFYGKYAAEKNPEFIFSSSDRFDEQKDRLRAVRFGDFKYIRNFNPQISNALPVSYRKQMPLMQNLNELWLAGKLNTDQKAWFKTPKPKEELYKLSEDPYELNNLAGIKKYQDTLYFFRNRLNQWIKETGDLGEIPEKKLLEQWFPQGQAKQLEPVVSKEISGKWVLNHPDSGATLVWKSPQETHWSLYLSPLEVKDPIEVKAVRIGYSDSPILTLD